MLLKSFWTSHLQMVKVLELLFKNWTGGQKGRPKGVDETTLVQQWENGKIKEGFKNDRTISGFPIQFEH